MRRPHVAIALTIAFAVIAASGGASVAAGQTRHRASDIGAAATSNSLVAWWKANGNARDSVGSSNGTLTGGTYAKGENGKAFDFDGSDDYVHIPAGVMSRIGGAIGVSAWINPTSLAFADGGGEVIGQYDTHDTLSSFELEILNGGIVTWGVVGPSCDWLGGGARSVETTSSIPMNTWTQIAGTFDPATQQLQILVNGIAVATQMTDSATVSSLCVAPTPITIGGGAEHLGGDLGNFFSGLVDDVTLSANTRAFESPDVKVAEPLTGIGADDCTNAMLAVTAPGVNAAQIAAACSLLLASENNESFPDKQTSASWEQFTKSKEYRGYLDVPPITVTCSSGKIVGYQTPANIKESLGYTKVTTGVATSYQDADTYTGTYSRSFGSPSYSVNASTNELDFVVRIASRLSDFERRAQFQLLGHDAPFIWLVVEEHVGCTGARIRVRQSGLPSEYVYVGNTLSSIDGPSLPSDLTTFIESGGTTLHANGQGPLDPQCKVSDIFIEGTGTSVIPQPTCGSEIRP